MQVKIPILLCLVLCLSACYEPQEGCQDIAATNFDASADKDCEMPCCIYPKLRMGVNQHYDSLSYVENTRYRNASGQWFVLRNVSFYLSDFQLFQQGVEHIVSDTVGLFTLPPTGTDTLREIFTDDFVLVRRVPLVNEVGTFRTDGNFENLRFRLGLDDQAQQVVPSRAPAGHPLRPQGDSLWHGHSEGFVFMQVIVARDTFPGTVSDTISLKKADIGNFVFDVTGAFKHETGYNFDLILDVDHAQLLRGIDWTTGDISAWKSQIVANLPHTFSVSQ